MKLIDADALRAEFPEPTDWRDIEQVMFHITGIWAAIDAAPNVQDSGKDARWSQINRQAAIDAMYGLLDAIKDCGEYAENPHIDIIIETLEELPAAQPEQRWIPCSEELPEEDYWLGGSGRQFSKDVLVTIVNHDDDDIWVDVTQTVDGEWALELQQHCEIIAWCPLPKPYREGGEK